MFADQHSTEERVFNKHARSKRRLKYRPQRKWRAVARFMGERFNLC